MNTICLVPYNNSERFGKIYGHLMATILEDVRIIIIDNSDKEDEQKKIEAMCQNDKVEYVKNDNRSLANANNKAIRMATGEYFIYLCTNHTRFYEDTWLDTIITEMQVKNADMGGTISHEVATHVQGGVFIARMDIMKNFLYNEVAYPFSFMDVDICQRLIKSGKKLLDMRTIYSTMSAIPAEIEKKWLYGSGVAIAHAHKYGVNP